MDFIADSGLVLYLPLYQLDGDSFMSKDAYGHLATNYGSIWTPQGRNFDGANDRITISRDIIGSNTYTICAWIRPSVVTSMAVVALSPNPPVFGNWGGNTAMAYLGINYYRTFTWTDYTTAFHFLVFVNADNTPSGQSCYADAQQLTVASTVSTGSAISRDRCYIGEAADQAWDYSGLIGEVIIYNRALTAQEVQHNYLATKWRYT